MSATMMAPTPTMTAPPLDHAATLLRLAELALTRHQQHVAQRTEAGRPPRLIFLRAALRCATWLTRHAQRQDAPEVAESILVPLVPMLAAVATAAAAADKQDEASGTYSGQPLTLWITCVTKQSQVDDLLGWARADLAQPEPVAPVKYSPPSAPDLDALDARLAALLKQTAHLLGEDETAWDDLLGDDDALTLTG